MQLAWIRNLSSGIPHARTGWKPNIAEYIGVSLWSNSLHVWTFSSSIHSRLVLYFLWRIYRNIFRGSICVISACGHWSWNHGEAKNDENIQNEKQRTHYDEHGKQLRIRKLPSGKCRYEDAPIQPSFPVPNQHFVHQTEINKHNHSPPKILCSSMLLENKNEVVFTCDSKDMSKLDGVK